MVSLIDLIGLSAVIQSLTWAAPVQLIIRTLTQSIWKCQDNKLRRLIEELFSCSVCLAFWIGLIWFGSIPLAGFTMLTVKLLETFYGFLPTKIQLE